jgi:hypothetical protein
MAGIKFDNTEILNTTYIPRFIKHESTPERELDLLALTRENGSVLVSEKYGVKKISLVGYLIGTSRSDLETKIDSFKELFSRKEKNLDIDWESGTRRYVATCSIHNFDRDYFNLDFVPWTAEFIVSEGAGENSTPTVMKNAELIDDNPKSYTIVFEGSTYARPVITLSIATTLSYACGVCVEQDDTGEKIVYNKQDGNAFASGHTIVIDFDNKKVTYDGSEQSFYGVFAKFGQETSTLSISFGRIIDQSFIIPNGYIDNSRIIYDVAKVAQSFTTPYDDSTYYNLGLYLSKIGTPAGNLTVRLETDNNNKPSGTLFDAHSLFTIDKDDVSASGAYQNNYYWGHKLALKSNTKYWIVLSMTGGDSSHCFIAPYYSGENATYKRGNMQYSIDGGTTWVDCPTCDIGFKLFYGGDNGATEVNRVNLTISYNKRYL